jgi:hypothetical protein
MSATQQIHAAEGLTYDFAETAYDTLLEMTQNVLMEGGRER